MNLSQEEPSAAKKLTPVKIAAGILVLAGLTYFGVSQYTKHAIQGTWKCTAGDGRLAGLYEFSDHSNYLETHSSTEQYYGDYSVGWKTIKTSIVGTTVGRLDADEKNPIKGEIAFIEKGKDNLTLFIWSANHTMGMAALCEKWSN